MKRQLPDHVLVGPYRYELAADKAQINQRSVDGSMFLRGETDYHALLIVVDPDLAPTKLAETILHEVLHTVTSMCGVIDDIGSKEEERYVARLAPALLDVLRRNPDLVAFLTS